MLAEFCVATYIESYSAFWLSLFKLMFMLIGMLDGRFHPPVLARLMTMEAEGWLRII